MTEVYYVRLKPDADWDRSQPPPASEVMGRWHILADLPRRGGQRFGYGGHPTRCGKDLMGIVDLNAPDNWGDVGAHRWALLWQDTRRPTEKLCKGCFR